MSFFSSHACSKRRKGEVGIEEIGEFSRNYLQGLRLCRGALLKKGHLYKSLYISMGMGIVGAVVYAYI